MIVALGTDVEVSLDLLLIDDLLAAIALDPEAIWDLGLALLGRCQFPLFLEPDHSFIRPLFLHDGLIFYTTIPPLSREQTKLQIAPAHVILGLVWRESPGGGKGEWNPTLS
jgi:hypothetical protein